MPEVPRAEEETALGDDDIIDAEPMPRSSGTFVREAAATVLDDDEVPTGIDALPIREATTMPADDEEDTPTGVVGVSDIIADLARLSNPSSIPYVRGIIDWGGLDEEETWILALIDARFTVKAILAMSPMNDETAIGILARLITQRSVGVWPGETEEDIARVIDDAWD